MIAKRMMTFLEVFTDKQYALIGSGSCSEEIIDFLSRNNIQLPEGIYDSINIGKRIGSLIIKDVNEVSDVDVLLLATYEFKRELTNKVSAISTGKVVTALSDFAVKNLKENEQHIRHPIIINTIPKCGNVFILSSLKKHLDIEHQDIGAGPFPEMNISEKSLRSCINQGMFSIDHFESSEYNLGALKDAGIKKIVVHARDPRQATLSWLHWLDRRYEQGVISQWETPKLENYFTLSLSEKLDYQIEHWLPSICQFLSDWLQWESNQSIEVKYTDFSLMSDDPNQFFLELYEFFGVKQKAPVIAKPQPGEMHFRKGLKNEWQDVFNNQQLEISSKMISDKLKVKFGWH